VALIRPVRIGNPDFILKIVQRSQHSLRGEQMQRVTGFGKMSVSLRRRVGSDDATETREKIPVLLKFVLLPIRCPLFPFCQVETDRWNYYCGGGDNRNGD